MMHTSFVYDYTPRLGLSHSNLNQYLYDGEGRLCAVNRGGSMTGYIYDADGARVAKGAISQWSCDPSANGFTATADYVLGLGGEQVTEMSGGAWQHSNVYAGGKLLATYDGHGLHFYTDDPLGTRRVQTDYAANVEQTCASLFYGDSLNCTGSTITPTEHHFTGKVHDDESGLDDFGARYYASNMGRWISPDWSAQAEPVPYAKLQNPQSLNLYAYVFNNPLRSVDDDGHDGCSVEGVEASCDSISSDAAEESYQQVQTEEEINAQQEQQQQAQAQQDDQGVPVVMPAGNTVPDSNSSTNQMMSPTSNLQPVADAGKAVGVRYAELMKKSPLLAGAYLMEELNHYVGHGGVFDYQRSGNAITGYDQLRQFRDVSNFNVGLFTRSAGLSLEQTMNMTRFLGSLSNYGSASLGPNGVPRRTEEFIRLGWFVGNEY